MKPTIVLTTILIACVNLGRAANTQTTISIHQTTTHHICQSQSNPSLLLNGDVSNTMDTPDENNKPPAKSKPKRQLGLKIFGGVVVAYGLLMLLSVIFGPLFPYK